MFMKYTPGGESWFDLINMSQITSIRVFPNTDGEGKVQPGREVRIWFVGRHDPMTLAMTDTQATAFERAVRDYGDGDNTSV